MKGGFNLCGSSLLCVLLLCGCRHDSVAAGSDPHSNGHFGKAVHFDGVDDYIEIPYSKSLDLGRTATFEVRLKLDGNSQEEGQIFNRYKSGAEDKKLCLYPDKRIGMTILGAGQIIGSMIVTAGTWHHVAVVLDGTEIRIYLDGARVGLERSTGDIRNADAAIRIGGAVRDTETLRPILGTLDELRVSYTARYGGNTFTPPTEPFAGDGDTALLLHLDEGSGSTTMDAGGHGNNGILGSGNRAPQWVDTD